MSYAARVHAEYRRFLRVMTPDQKAALEALPGLEGRLFFKRYLTEIGEERYRLVTKPVKGRPSHPYRLARYSSFVNLWYHLVRLGALEFVQEEPATGRVEGIDLLHPARIQNEQGVGVGGWGAVDPASRPRRRYYRLTPQGEVMDLSILLRPKDYLRTRGRVVTVLTAEELRGRLDTRLAAISQVVGGANAGMEAGLSTGVVLPRIVQGLGDIRHSLAQFLARELEPARRSGVEVQDVLSVMERQDAILASLMSVLRPPPEGLAGVVDRIAKFTPEEFREALIESGYQEVAGQPLLAAIFSVLVPAGVSRIPEAQVNSALQQRVIQAQEAFKMMMAAVKARDLDEAKRQRAFIYTTARQGVEEGVIGTLGLPVRTDAQFTRQAIRLFFLAKLHRVVTLVGLWEGLMASIAREGRSLTLGDTRALLGWEAEIASLLG